MEEYSIFFKKSVEKDLVGIPKTSLAKILQRIETMKTNPRPQGSENSPARNSIAFGREYSGSFIQCKTGN